MATMDIFEADGFTTRELSDAINIIPNQWGRIGEMGLFAPKPIRTPLFQIESKNGVLQIVQSSERGSSIPTQGRGKRKLVPLSTARFALDSQITADDISGIRAFGSETELAQVEDEVADRQIELRGSMDITREYLRAGALQGVVKDADGSTLVDLHATFGITKKSVDFDFGTSGVDTAAKARSVGDHIRVNLLGDVMAGVHALCDPGFWDKLMADEGFKRAYDNYMVLGGLNPLRDDVSGGFSWQDITWEKYLGEGQVPQEDGTTVTRSFVPQNEAMFFPVGTRTTFRQYNAPADYMEVVNSPGLDFYSKVMPDPKANRYVDVEAQMNTVPICMRPGVLVRGHTSS